MESDSLELKQRTTANNTTNGSHHQERRVSRTCLRGKSIDCDDWKILCLFQKTKERQRSKFGLTNESVQTNAGDAVQEGRLTTPGNGQLTEDEIERRACQGFAKLPHKQDPYDLWRYHSPAVRDRILRKAEQAEKALAHAEGKSFEQDPHTVPTADEASITTGASSSSVGISSVSSRNSEIKQEYPGGRSAVPDRRRRKKAPTRNSTLLGLATSASSKRRLDPDETMRDTPPRRRRINKPGKGTRKTRIKQEKKTQIKQEFEDDAAVFLGEDAALPYKDISDEALLAQEASDALSEEKNGAS